MAEPVTAQAAVATPTPERYAKQLAAHLGRRLEVREEPDGIRLVFRAGDGREDGDSIGNCLLRPLDEALELTVTAVGPAELDRITQVVGSHLERFGQRNELAVVWSS